MWIIMHDFAWNPCMHPSIHLLLCTKTNAPSGLFLTFLAKWMPISMAVWMKMCKTWVFSDMWLLILTPDSSLFSTPPNHRDHNAPCLWHPNWTRDTLSTLHLFLHSLRLPSPCCVQSLCCVPWKRQRRNQWVMCPDYSQLPKGYLQRALEGMERERDRAPLPCMW